MLQNNIDDLEYTQTKEEWLQDQFGDTITPSDILLDTEDQILGMLNQDALEEALVKLIEAHPVEYESLLLQARTDRNIEKVYESSMGSHLQKILKK